MSDRYRNVIPVGRRHGYYHKDRFSTGSVRDGHKLLRNACDEDGIEVIHPPECGHQETSGGVTYVSYDRCPWAQVYEMFDGPLQAYCDGEESDRLTDLDRVLPRGVDVEVTWEYSGGASWTNYGWEYDAEFCWWFGDEPWIGRER